MTRIRVSTPSIIPPGVTTVAHMTVLAERYETLRPRTGRRFMSQSRTDKLDDIRKRVARGEYAVDPQDVAGAIVRRLLDGSRQNA